jgi:hypothetical protein
MTPRGLREKYPSFFAFGETQKFLTSEEAPAATPEERIASVWPFLVSQVMAFQQTLKPRQRVNYDPEDTLAELWIELREKDDKWEPARGKYITFVGTIVEHKLYALRDQAHTVHSPRNSTCRLKQYQREEAAGTLTDRRAKTAADIRRVVGEFEPVGEEDSQERERPDHQAAENERLALAREIACEALMSVDTAIEARIIGLSFGLMGKDPKDPEQIAAETGYSLDQVRRIRSRALSKARAALKDAELPDAAL